MHFRTLQAMGVQLLGRLTHSQAGKLHFAGDLAESVAFGDARYTDIGNLIEDLCKKEGLPIPPLPEPPPFDATAPESIDVSRLSTVIFSSGFRPDYTSWVNIPTFDELGFPLHKEGVSTVAPGLYFVGVHFLRTRKSSLFFGVGEDAIVVADQIAGGDS
jgi:putative flavoprotein involved in K+ transport